jgi:peptide/nickel transport system permease protein
VIVVLRRIAVGMLIAVGLVAAGAGFLPTHDYAAQFRKHANEPPSRFFPLGTDSLGRDRFARLLQASRVSLLCAPAAAVAATAAAAGVGLAAGYYGGWVNALTTGVTDLFLSVPWLFVLLTLRALLPLNVSPHASLAATFGMLAAIGWASGSRVVRANVMALLDSEAILHARAYGCSNRRILRIHILPNLRPVLSAQFWILVPVFLLSEANLGLLGLGVSEPMPSLGSMLLELQNYQRIPEAPWMLAPAVLLALVVASLHFVVSGSQTWE